MRARPRIVNPGKQRAPSSHTTTHSPRTRVNLACSLVGGVRPHKGARALGQRDEGRGRGQRLGGRVYALPGHGARFGAVVGHGRLGGGVWVGCERMEWVRRGGEGGGRPAAGSRLRACRGARARFSGLGPRRSRTLGCRARQQQSCQNRGEHGWEGGGRGEGGVASKEGAKSEQARVSPVETLASFPLSLSPFHPYARHSVSTTVSLVAEREGCHGNRAWAAHNIKRRGAAKKKNTHQPNKQRFQGSKTTNKNTAGGTMLLYLAL